MQRHHPSQPLPLRQAERHIERHAIPNQKQAIQQLSLPRQPPQHSPLQRGARSRRAPQFPPSAPATSRNTRPTATNPASPSRPTKASSCPSFTGTGTGTPSIDTTHIASIA